MNFLVGVYNISAMLGIGLILIIMVLTITAYRNDKKNKNRTHFIISLLVEASIILFLLHMLFNGNRTTKKVLGGLELL